MKKILLIDDDDVFNESLKEYLEYKKFEVACAFDGKQGLSMMSQVQPDLIITDIVMPQVEGIELLDKVLQDSASAPPKVIVISGGGRMGGSDYLNIAKEMGADSTFEKPVDFNRLVETIDRLLV